MDKPTKKRKFDDALSTEVDDLDLPAAKRHNRATGPDFSDSQPRTYSYDTSATVEFICVNGANGYGYGYGVQYPQGSSDVLSARQASTELNEEFQRACECPTDTAEQRLQRLTEFGRVYEKFVARATEIGKVIIEEMQIASRDKTITRYTNRGIAGGEKFCCDGIFFKLATDSFNLYGGDCYSMKAAGHEIQALNELIRCDIQGLHLPNMLVLDYFGYRVVAEAALPISHVTLCYGSDNGCKTVHDDNPMLTKLVDRAAQLLNVKPHVVGLGLTKEPKLLSLPGDVEGHVGKDNRLYLVDVQRIYPSEDEFNTIIAIKIPYKSDGEIEIVRILRNQIEVEVSKLIGEQHDWIETQFPEPMLILYYADTSQTDSPLLPWTYLSTTNREEQDRMDGYEADESDDPMPISTPLPKPPKPVRDPATHNKRASLLVDQAIYGDAVVIAGSKREVLYYMIRPEFLRQSPTPISSDVFTKFGEHDKTIHEHEARELTHQLREVTIPEFVRTIMSRPELVISALHLPPLLHTWGINLRYIGLIYTLLDKNYPPTDCNRRLRENIVGFQMLVRVLKNLLQSKLRVRKFDQESSYKEFIVQFFNVVFGQGPETDDFWSVVMPFQVLLKYSPFGLELRPDDRQSLRRILGKYTLFQLLQEYTGVQFKPEAALKFRDPEPPKDKPSPPPISGILIEHPASNSSDNGDSVEGVEFDPAHPLTVDDFVSIKVKITKVDLRQHLDKVTSELYDIVLTKMDQADNDAYELTADDLRLSRSTGIPQPTTPLSPWENGSTSSTSPPSPCLSGLSSSQTILNNSCSRLVATHDLKHEKEVAWNINCSRGTADMLKSFTSVSPRNLAKYESMLSTSDRSCCLNRLRLKKLVFQTVATNPALKESTNLVVSAAVKCADLYSQLGYIAEAGKYFQYAFSSLQGQEVYVEILLSAFYLLAVALERAKEYMESIKYFLLVVRWVEALFESEHDVVCATPFEAELHARLRNSYEAIGNIQAATYHKYKVDSLSAIFVDVPIAYDRVWEFLSFIKMAGLTAKLHGYVSPQILDDLGKLDQLFQRIADRNRGALIETH